MSDLNKTNALIHEALAQALLDRIRSGEATAADLNVARQYLKDNNITSAPLPDSPMTKLIKELPFSDETGLVN